MSNPYAVYIKNMENISSKEEMLVKVFEEILSKLNIAIYAIEEGDVKTKAENLTKVTDALSILQISLDFEKGGEIAQNLYEIYQFCIEELIKANTYNDKEKIKDIIEVLTPIYEGFKESLQKLKG